MRHSVFRNSELIFDNAIAPVHRQWDSMARSRQARRRSLMGRRRTPCIARLGGIKGGIVKSGGDAGGGEGIDLIFHQRNEWGDDEGEAIPGEGGELEGKGFPGACGEDGDDVLSGHGGRHDFQLEGAEGIVAEVLFQEGGKLVVHSARVGIFFLLASKKMFL